MVTQPSNSDINQLEKKLLKLERAKQYRTGLGVIGKYIKKYEMTDEILLHQAFILYHRAVVLMYNGLRSSPQKIFIKKNFRRAVAICKLVLRKYQDRDTNDRNILNARLYLAQIYVMLGHNKKAKTFARQTYKYFPCTLTAERVADIYLRSKDHRGAIIWYKVAVKKTRKFVEKLIAQLGLAVCYKQINKAKCAINEARTALRFLKKAGKNKGAELLGKSLYTHFPELDKTK